MSDLSDEGGEQIAEVITLHLPAHGRIDGHRNSHGAKDLSFFLKMGRQKKPSTPAPEILPRGRGKRKWDTGRKNPGKYRFFCRSAQATEENAGGSGDSVKLHKSFPAPARSGKNLCNNI
jgi:hypothetical protein